MTRLPRAEDEVIMFIAVNGVPVRAEGTIQRITLRSGVALLRPTMEMLPRTISGEITVTLRSMQEADGPEGVETIDIYEGGERVDTIIVPERGRPKLELVEGGDDDEVSPGDGAPDAPHDPLDP